MRTPVAVTFAALLLFAGSPTASAADDEGRAFAEHAMQAYLSMWSNDGNVNPQSVARFYAPQVTYYGKEMTRAQVLADKLTFIKQWPDRTYQAVPGTFTGKCGPDRMRCTVTVVMSWRRTDRSAHVSTGRALVSLEFVPSDGTRKIARESARIL